MCAFGVWRIRPMSRPHERARFGPLRRVGREHRRTIRIALAALVATSSVTSALRVGDRGRFVMCT
jgi:hypothetical protein